MIDLIYNKNQENIKNLITTGCEALGLYDLNINLTEQKIEKLLVYINLLIKWNKVYNLTAIINPHDIAVKHILDCLATVPHIYNLIRSIINNYNLNNISLLDVGSGAGLPGIIIAILFFDDSNYLVKNLNNFSINLLDSNNKKTIFQQQAIIELGLAKNSSIKINAINSRIEDYSDLNNIVISRAFASIKDFVSLTKHLLAENGILLAMKSKKSKSVEQEKSEVLEFNNIENNKFYITEQDIYKLEVPYLDEDRYLIQITQKNNL